VQHCAGLESEHLTLECQIRGGSVILSDISNFLPVCYMQRAGIATRLDSYLLYPSTGPGARYCR
jgi:hypothetical protein